MTPIQRVLETLKKLETKYPQPQKPSDKPTYNEGAAFVVKELLQQVETEVENEKSIIIESYLFGKVDGGNKNDATDYYNKISN